MDVGARLVLFLPALDERDLRSLDSWTAGHVSARKAEGRRQKGFWVGCRGLYCTWFLDLSCEKEMFNLLLDFLRVYNFMFLAFFVVGIRIWQAHKC